MVLVIMLLLGVSLIFFFLYFYNFTTEGMFTGSCRWFLQSDAQEMRNRAGRKANVWKCAGGCDLCHCALCAV